MKKSFIIVLSFIFSFSLPCTEGYAQVDLSVFGRQKSLLDYQNEEQMNDLQQQLQVQQLQLMQQQNEELRRQKKAQSQSDQTNKQLTDSKIQIFREANDQISAECVHKYDHGKYKSRSAMIRLCITPQVVQLAEQMNMENAEEIKGYQIYVEKIVTKIEKKELSNEEGAALIDSYIAAH
jgi:hypothetical protein